MFRYVATNDMGPKNTFKLRFAYKHTSFPDSIYRQINGWENSFDSIYGKVDRNGDAVYLVVDEGVSVTHFDSSPAGIFAVNFVVRAFEKLRKDYFKRIAGGTMGEIPFFGKFQPVSGWVNFDDLRLTYLSDLQDFFIESYIGSELT